MRTKPGLLIYIDSRAARGWRRNRCGNRLTLPTPPLRRPNPESCRGHPTPPQSQHLQRKSPTTNQPTTNQPTHHLTKTYLRDSNELPRPPPANRRHSKSHYARPPQPPSRIPNARHVAPAPPPNLRQFKTTPLTPTHLNTPNITYSLALGLMLGACYENVLG